MVQGRWEPGKVVKGSWAPEDAPTSRDHSLVVVEGSWEPENEPTSHRDSLVVVDAGGGGG